MGYYRKKRYHPYTRLAAKAATGLYRYARSVQKEKTRLPFQYPTKYNKPRNQPKKKAGGSKQVVKQVGRPIYSAGDITQSFTSLYYKPMKGYVLKHQFPKDLNRRNGTGGITATIGRQGYLHTGQFGDSDRWGQLFSDALETTTNMDNLDPLGATNEDRRLWIDWHELVYYFTNQSPDLIEVTLYDVLCKRSGVPDPKAAWEDGLTQGSGLSLVTADVPQSKPFDSSLFKQSWKVLRTTKIHMASGANHRHIFRHKVNGIVPISTSDNYSVDTNMKGYTLSTLVVVSGMPVDSTKGESVGTVTIAPAKLIWTWAENTQTRLVGLKTRKLHFENNFNTSLTTDFYAQNPDSLGIAVVRGS